jgi:hypothetical protein
VSRFDSDQDFHAWLNGDDEIHPNASCSDCGVDYSKAEGDPTTTCDACSDRRDQWAEAYQQRLAAAAEAMQQAKAALRPRRKKEVA